MILTENWVQNKLRYWSILHLSIYIIISVALITLIQETDEEFAAIWILIITGFQLFLLITEFCYLIGLSRRSTCLITFWQVVFIVYIGLISIGVIIGLIIAITGLVHEVIKYNCLTLKVLI